MDMTVDILPDSFISYGVLLGTDLQYRTWSFEGKGEKTQLWSSEVAKAKERKHNGEGKIRRRLKER